MIVCGYEKYKIYSLGKEILLQIDNDSGRKIKEGVKLPRNSEKLLINGREMEVILFNLSEQEKELLLKNNIINILVFKDQKWSGLFHSKIEKQQMLLEYKKN